MSLTVDQPSLNGSLPDFLIIGITKGGTTALIRNLALHPDVHTAGTTGTHELYFFNQHWEKGIDWYRSRFTRPDKLQGEKTPNYLMSHVVHERIAATVPNAKLIISLRNPVNRAYSQWNHFNQIADETARWGWRAMKFADAIRQPDPAMVSLIQSGYYMKNIRNLMKHFPRNQIHIMISERLRQNAEAEYLKLLTFLNLKPSDHPFENKHERQYAEPMAPHMRQMLERHYRPSNLDLMEFLNDPIPEWDES